MGERVPQSERPDAELASAGAAGDQRALETLLRRHQDRMFAVCVRMVGDAEWARDLTQDAMVKVIEGVGTFDGRASFTTWLTRVTMNVCLSHLRREKHRRHASLDAPAGGRRPGSASGGGFDGGSTLAATRADEREPEAGRGVQSREELAMLKRGLQALEDEQRAILILRDVRGLEYRQIAEVLDVAVGTVKSRLFRARSSLRSAIEAEEASGAGSPPGATRGRIGTESQSHLEGRPGG